MNNKILIVDDTPDLLENVSQYLTLEGFEVQSCSDGEEALEKLKQFHPDLIITDQFMPKLAGDELIESITKDHDLDEVALAIFSASAVTKKIKEIQKIRTIGYIAKPIEMEDLLAIISNIEGINLIP